MRKWLLVPLIAAAPAAACALAGFLLVPWIAAPPAVERMRNFAGGEPQVVDAREFYRILLRRPRETQALPPNALAEPAQKRGLAIEAALQAAGADASRISRTIAAPTSDAEVEQVILQLSLAAN